ncbi:hypothetical protein P7C70_g4194, partial [Phenoliferia sp. Uapishka_3]
MSSGGGTPGGALGQASISRPLPQPPAHQWPTIAPSPHPNPSASASNSNSNSPPTQSSKRKTLVKPRKKQKEDDRDPQDEAESGASGDDDEGGRKAKRARMALSCKEVGPDCIRCDRNMPVCGMCEKRGRPADCTWDLLSNDAALPPTIARTSDVDALVARLAHVESYLRTLPPNLAPFTPYTPQIPSSHHHPPSANSSLRILKAQSPGFSDTEDAAVLLENGVFGTRPITGPDSPENDTGSRGTRRGGEGNQRAGRGDARESRFGSRGSDLTKALTSIVAHGRRIPSRAHLNVEFDSTQAEVETATTSATQRILRAIPPRAVVQHLVNLYFTRVSWLFHHLHAPSFLIELDAFYVLVICVALDSTHASRSPLSLDSSLAPGVISPLSAFSDEQLRAFPDIWFQASQAALALGCWESQPRVRSVQAIVLFTQYLQLCSSSRGQPSQLVVWLAGAIKIAQVLGLHLLGSNSETMPVDDPAWPPGRNSMKRESAKRLWACLLYQDWVGASSKHRTYLIAPLHFDTDDPSNLNDSDLSSIDFKVTPVPSNVLTDSTADRVRVSMARQARKVFDAVVLRKDLTYETVLELDRGFREILESLPDQWTLETTAEETEQPMLRYQRHFAGEGLHNRVMGAALVLFADLFHAIDSDLSAAEIDAKRSTLVLAAQTFAQSDEIASPSLKSVVQQGGKILEGLFRAEESRRDGRAARVLLLAGGAIEDGDEETFAEVLQRISRSLSTNTEPHRGTPPPTRGIPSASTFRMPAYPPFPNSTQLLDESALSTWPFPSLPTEATDALSLDFFQDLGGNDDFWSNNVSAPWQLDPDAWQATTKVGGLYELPDQYGGNTTERAREGFVLLPPTLRMNDVTLVPTGVCEDDATERGMPGAELTCRETMLQLRVEVLERKLQNSAYQYELGRLFVADLEKLLTIQRSKLEFSETKLRLTEGVVGDLHQQVWDLQIELTKSETAAKQLSAASESQPKNKVWKTREHSI